MQCLNAETKAIICICGVKLLLQFKVLKVVHGYDNVNDINCDNKTKLSLRMVNINP